MNKHSAGRDTALQLALDTLDDGSFYATLARRVAQKTISQDTSSMPYWQAIWMMK